MKAWCCMNPQHESWYFYVQHNQSLHNGSFEVQMCKHSSTLQCSTATCPYVRCRSPETGSNNLSVMLWILWWIFLCKIINFIILLKGNKLWWMKFFFHLSHLWLHKSDRVFLPSVTLGFLSYTQPYAMKQNKFLPKKMIKHIHVLGGFNWFCLF